MAIHPLRLLAVLLMALALVPAGAHFFELPGKIGLDRDAYFTVQQIYAGWAFFGIVLFGAVAANLALAASLRHERLPFALALIGAAAMIANLAIFFAWTFPANQATANWTEIPENWEALRRQWEFSHAANAVLVFAGFVSVVLATMLARR